MKFSLEQVLLSVLLQSTVIHALPGTVPTGSLDLHRRDATQVGVHPIYTFGGDLQRRSPGVAGLGKLVESAAIGAEGLAKKEEKKKGSSAVTGALEKEAEHKTLSTAHPLLATQGPTPQGSNTHPAPFASGEKQAPPTVPQKPEKPGPRGPNKQDHTTALDNTARPAYRSYAEALKFGPPNAPKGVKPGPAPRGPTAATTEKKTAQTAEAVSKKDGAKNKGQDCGPGTLQKRGDLAKRSSCDESDSEDDGRGRRGRRDRRRTSNMPPAPPVSDFYAEAMKGGRSSGRSAGKTVESSARANEAPTRMKPSKPRTELPSPTSSEEGRAFPDGDYKNAKRAQAGIIAEDKEGRVRMAISGKSAPQEAIQAQVLGRQFGTSRREFAGKPAGQRYRQEGQKALDRHGRRTGGASKQFEKAQEERRRLGRPQFPGGPRRVEAEAPPRFMEPTSENEDSNPHKMWATNEQHQSDITGALEGLADRRAQQKTGKARRILMSGYDINYNRHDREGHTNLLQKKHHERQARGEIPNADLDFVHGDPNRMPQMAYDDPRAGAVPKRSPSVDPYSSTAPPPGKKGTGARTGDGKPPRSGGFRSRLAGRESGRRGSSRTPQQSAAPRRDTRRPGYPDQNLAVQGSSSNPNAGQDRLDEQIYRMNIATSERQSAQDYSRQYGSGPPLTLNLPPQPFPHPYAVPAPPYTISSPPQAFSLPHPYAAPGSTGSGRNGGWGPSVAVSGPPRTALTTGRRPAAPARRRVVTESSSSESSSGSSSESDSE